MEKDNAVRNQKVMIRLGSVLDLQQRYMRVAASYDGLKGAFTPADKTRKDSFFAEKRTYEQVIDMLELPIQKV